MEELLPFLQKYEIWIYALLGAVAFVYLQRLISAWKIWQGSVFGLEREIGQRRFSTALTILVLLVVFILVEFVIVSFVAPSSLQVYALPTPTLDLLATPTITLPVAAEAVTATGSAVGVDQPAAVGTPGIAGESTPNAANENNPASGATTPTVALTAQAQGCIAGQIEWSYPKAGDEINSTIELKGTVNVPNLGFYKYEYAHPGEDVWNTIAAGNQPKVNGQIGFWNTSQVEPGDYLLRLVVADNQNQLLPACEIPVRITSTQQ